MMNIDEMQAGREMDQLIGKEIMGLDFSQSSRLDYHWDGAMLEVPRYSTDISAACEVVEKAIDIGPLERLGFLKSDRKRGRVPHD